MPMQLNDLRSGDNSSWSVNWFYLWHSIMACIQKCSDVSPLKTTRHYFNATKIVFRATERSCRTKVLLARDARYKCPYDTIPYISVRILFLISASLQ